MAPLPRLRSLLRPSHPHPSTGPGDPSAGASDEHRTPGAPTSAQRPYTARTTADVEAAVPFTLRVAAGISWRLAAVALAGWGLLQVLAATTTIVIPVAVALLLTALLMPVQVLLNHRLGLPRHAAGAVTVLGGILVFVGAVGIAGNQLVTGVAELSDQMANAVTQIQNWLRTGPLQIGGDQLSRFIDQGRAWLSSNSSQLTSGALAVGSSAGTFFTGALIALIATFFFLAEGDRIWSWFVRLLPRPSQAPIHEAFRRGWVSLGSYVKTQVFVAFIDAFFIAAGAFALGLPLVVPLALIIFFASAVPIVGAVVSGALAVLLALVVKGFSSAIIMLIIVLAVQQLESNVLQPLLMGKAVSLHPLAVLLGVAGFSFLLGIVGALFAVPIMAVTNTVLLYLRGHDAFPALATGASALEHSPKELTHADGDAEHEEPTSAAPRVGDVSPTDLAAHRRLDDLERQGDGGDAGGPPSDRGPDARR
ncbi:AI-2E family transporter [Agilicoccus flavus]|uniref:AI-2E family transporter n=1 Tax=Agilicoccus flavus TaxID=2775968 RepID=UPI001CF6A161|nr:AI-2E family transporter [Agilicoccus flavus]